jgi:ketosteroid isomerase-like protein
MNQHVADFTVDADLRQQNYDTVADYMARKGETRRTRYQLFTEDGSAGLWTNDTYKPIMSTGHKKLKAHGEWSLKMFPDWEWLNVEIHATQDPNQFWVECDGEGTINYPSYPTATYRNHFVHSFTFEDGKIKVQREFMNPLQQMNALGIDVPTINRGGIPT